MARGFPFPGDAHGIYEIGAQHDFVHVLADYTPTPEGEIDVFAFIAAAMPDGQRRVLLAVTLGLFQNGVDPPRRRQEGRRSPGPTRSSDPGAIDHFADALRRGRSSPST